MDNLILNQTLASLPVTDISHVVKEINQHRLVLEMIEQARKMIGSVIKNIEKGGLNNGK